MTLKTSDEVYVRGFVERAFFDNVFTVKNADYVEDQTGWPVDQYAVLSKEDLDAIRTALHCGLTWNDLSPDLIIRINYAIGG